MQIKSFLHCIYVLIFLGFLGCATDGRNEQRVAGRHESLTLGERDKPSRAVVLNPALKTEEVLAVSLQFLPEEQQRLLKDGLSPDATVTPITFANGDRGAFVLLGFSSRLSYQLLYRVRGQVVELVEFHEDPVWWGQTCTPDGDQLVVPVLPTFVDVQAPDGKRKRLLKVAVAIHPGTGMFSCGFALLEVTDQGLVSAFDGSEFDVNANPGGSRSTSRFQIITPSGQGPSEILEEGEDCSDYQESSDNFTNCHPRPSRRFRYDGWKFNPVQE